MITGVEDEGEIRTEERKEICAGTPLMATHAYTKNRESPVGKEIDLRQWDTLIFKGEFYHMCRLSRKQIKVILSTK